VSSLRYARAQADRQTDKHTDRLTALPRPTGGGGGERMRVKQLSNYRHIFYTG